jgi:predicted small secreted protein
MRTFLTLALAATLLAGCAGMSSVSSDVSSFGEWPAGRAPGTYAFDRLPSQQTHAAETERLETAARPALLKAGFQPAAEGQAPDVLVQVGARTTYADYQPWGDPLWWHGGFGYGAWRSPMWYGRGWGWGWSGYYNPPRYDREVAILLRDRITGKPLFEARASNDGFSQADDPVLAAMFEAALFDFPKLGINPRRVVVPVGPPASVPATR